MAVSSGTVQVIMPAMGDSVAEGTVLEWHKQEGDSVEADETLVEISTDKVDAEVPSPAAGTVVKIHAAEGDTVAVGAVLAEIATNGAARVECRRRPRRCPASRRRPRPSEAVAGADTEAEGVAAAEAATGETIDIVTPTGGESVTEGTILEWSGQGRRRGQAGRHRGRDLDRQGRHGAARARRRDDHRDPRRRTGRR